MMFLLDTNILSESRKAAEGRADPNVTAWLADADAEKSYVSVITLMEIEMGILRLERRDRMRGAMLRRWMSDQVLPEFVDRVVSIDSAIALRCASLHVPDQRPERDALIAATALVHGMTVATRNVADFRSIGVSTVNPWEYR